MEVKLLIPSVYWESVIQVSIHTYRLQIRHFNLLLSFWNAKGSLAPPPWQKVRVVLPLVPETLAVFEKIYVYRHGVLVVTAFALHQGRRQKNFQGGEGNGKKDRKIALLSLFHEGPTKKKTKNGHTKIPCRRPCLGVGRPGFNSCRVRPKDLKSWYSQFPCLTIALKG